MSNGELKLPFKTAPDMDKLASFIAALQYNGVKFWAEQFDANSVIIYFGENK